MPDKRLLCLSRDIAPSLPEGICKRFEIIGRVGAGWPPQTANSSLLFYSVSTGQKSVFINDRSIDVVIYRSSVGTDGPYIKTLSTHWRLLTRYPLL